MHEKTVRFVQAIEGKDGGVLLRVRVHPKASRNALSMDAEGRVRAALTAPPVGGAANKALIALIAKTLRVAKGAVTVVQGERSREKTLWLTGVNVAQVQAKLVGKQ